MTCEDAWRVVGELVEGGILVVSDHASNRVPADIDLGIEPALLYEHVSVDIGVKLWSETISAGRTPSSNAASAA